MKKLTKFAIIPIVVFLILVVPVISFSYKLGDPLVPPADCKSVAGQCTWGFTEFLTLIDNVIQFALFVIAVPIAAIMFAYAGFILITAGEEAASARTKAKDIFFNAAIGLAVAAAAWLIIRTILSILGYNGAWIGF